MAARTQDFVVFIEQTYDNGVLVDEVRAPDSYHAFEVALEANGIDPARTPKFVRNWWVVRGRLC